ncbi:MAG: DUF4190 domain-containing protein [Lachnospiraceae bacterium]|nr:DUF4190 domain-containing protein [Lachnospiraceae bacterium]
MNNDKKINCIACGGENKATNTFCMNCGERLIPGEAANPVPQASSEPTIERADAEVVSSTPWYNEGNTSRQNNKADQSNPYQNTGSSYNPPPKYTAGGSENTGNSGLAIASLVCGIVSIFCCYFSFFVSAAGLITGIMALVKKQPGRGMAIAGIIISSISILFYVIVFVAIIIFSAFPAFWLF